MSPSQRPTGLDILVAPLPDSDVIVSGGGLAGVACAQVLARAGQRVTLAERRGTLGWEIGRARRAFLDLEAARQHSPLLAELYDGLSRAGAYADGVLRAPLVELELDRWLIESGVRPLFHAWPVAMEVDGDRVAGVTLATKSGYRSLRVPCVIETDQYGRLVRPYSTSQDNTAAVRACIVIGVEPQIAARGAQAVASLPDPIRAHVVRLAPLVGGQVQLDVQLTEGSYQAREQAFSRLLPQVLAALRQAEGWEQAALAYVADDEWAKPAIAVPTAPPQGPKLGHLVGPGNGAQTPVLASDVVMDGLGGLYLAGPWIAPALAASAGEAAALLNRVLLGEMVGRFVVQQVAKENAKGVVGM